MHGPKNKIDTIFLLKFGYHVTTPGSASPRLKVLVCSRCKGLKTQILHIFEKEIYIPF